MLYLFSVFTFRSVRMLTIGSKHLHCLLQVYDDTFNPLDIQGAGVHPPP